MTVGGETGETSCYIIGGRCVVPALAVIDVAVDVSIYSGTFYELLTIIGCYYIVSGLFY